MSSGAATVSDSCDNSVSVVYDIPPGSTFAAGTTTTVMCTATDASGNQAHCDFNVTVESLAAGQREAITSILNQILM
ncbi:MAG: HYR domain-containing protein [Gammaproteobacteria bacterium]|nr:HYR domain-containing protein [Gammaproteobacteria bacterium]